MAFTRENIKKNYYTTGEVADLFQVSTKTIQKWDNKGILKFERSPTNRRVLPKETLIEYLKSKNMFYEDESLYKRDVIYARVSTYGQQKQGDLDRQVDYILSNRTDLKNVLILKEVKSSLDSKRKKLLKLIDMILNDEVNRIFITHKGVLTEFCFEYIEAICNHHDVEIIVMQSEQDNKLVEQELEKDIKSLLATLNKEKLSNNE
jgi:excisionase family DNA binding protein